MSLMQCPPTFWALRTNSVEIGFSMDWRGCGFRLSKLFWSIQGWISPISDLPFHLPEIKSFEAIAIDLNCTEK